MAAPDWIAKFRTLHQGARGRKLAGEDARAYEESKERFARAVLAAQGLSLPPGESVRRFFRIGVVFPLELLHGKRKLRTATLDLSLGGFSSMADLPINKGEVVEFTLTLPNATSLGGKAKMVAKVIKEKGSRLSFAFEGLSAEEEARLEVRLFDLALERMPE